MAKFSTFKVSWPWPWPLIGSYCIPSCISRRPLPTYQISLKSKKLYVYGRADGHLRLTVLGRLGEVDLKTEWLIRNGPGKSPWRQSGRKKWKLLRMWSFNVPFINVDGFGHDHWPYMYKFTEFTDICSALTHSADCKRCWSALSNVTRSRNCFLVFCMFEDIVYGAVIMSEAIVRVHQVQLMNVDSAWHSGRTSVFGRRTFSVLRSTCSWRVPTYVGKPSAMGQLTRPTQPFIPLGSINE